MNRMRQLLVETSSQLFARAGDPEIQDAVDAGTFPEELWNEIESNGLPSAMLPERDGGAGLDLCDTMAVLRVAGAFAVPLPLAETVLARLVLSRSKIDIPAGPTAIVTGAPATPLDLRPLDERLLLSGRATVPWPERLSHCLLVGASDHGESMAVVATSELALEATTNAAGEPIGLLHADGDELETTSGALAPPEELSRSTLLRFGALARTCQMAGAMERILDMATEHVRGREQFGRPIARFQAVQHLVAQLAAEVAAVSVAAEAAALAEQRGSHLEAAVAKARASEAVEKVLRIGHQVHGALGYTREHALHRFTRRLITWRSEFGDEIYWQHQVGQRFLAEGPSRLWELLAN